jgi:hypothetical protein
MSTPIIKANLTPERIVKWLFGMVAVLLAANLLAIYTKYVMGHPYQIFWLFYFDEEANIPTLYSFVVLVICSVFLWITGSLEKVKIQKQSIFWKGLACVFAFIAIDELSGIHETFNNDGTKLLGGFTADGYLYYAWLIPYGVFFAVISIFFVKQYLRLPRQTKFILFIGMAVFLAGSVIFEMIGARYVATHDEGMDRLGYALIATVEELLEKIGIIIFLYAILKFYVAQHGKAEFRISISQKTKVVNNLRGVS